MKQLSSAPKPKGQLTDAIIDKMEIWLKNGNGVDGVLKSLRDYEYGEEHFPRLEKLIAEWRKPKQAEAEF
jgi:hypothetical protein